MNEKDRLTMEAHGITCVPKNVYSYKGFRYDRLIDAVSYAETDRKRARERQGFIISAINASHIKES